MLEEILESLDLNREEMAIYFELLEGGNTTAGVLAKKLAMARPTLYGMLQKMHDKGVVMRSLRHGVRTFAAEPPQKLSQLFEKRIERLQAHQKQFLHMLPQLEQKAGAQLVKPRFQFYEGREGVQSVLKDMLMYYDRETLALWPIRSMIGILSADFFRWHNKQRIQNNLYTRAIWPEEGMVSVKNHPYLGVGEAFKREIRVAPPGLDFSMGYWIYHTKVAFLSSRAESFGFIIESAEMVAMLRAQFEVLWNLSKPLQVSRADMQPFIDELKG